MERISNIDSTARWWTQATQEARFRLLQRIIGTKAPQKGDPTLEELKLAIILAEAEAKEIIYETGPAR
jgi:hypothetical protein